MLIPHYIELIQFFWKMMRWKVGHKSHLHNQGEVFWTIYKLSVNCCGRIVCSFRSRPTPLFAWWMLSFMCSLNHNLLSRVSPRSFWFEPRRISELLEKSDGCVVSFLFLEKIFFFPCLVWSELNCIFYWYGQSIFFNRSLLSTKAEVLTQFTMLNKEVSSAKSLTLEVSPSGRSLI